MSTIVAEETAHPADRFTRRLRGALRRDAKRLLTPGPSTVPMLMLGPRVPDDAHVQQVLDVCMRVGEIQLSSGESVDEVTATMLRLANAAGLPAVDVDITFTSITMCCHRGNAAQPVTSMRLVRYRTLDLSRLAETDRVVADLEAGRLDMRAASARVADVVNQRHPYPRWVATVGWAGLAASIALLLGGGAITAAAAFGTTAVIDRIGRLLNRLGVAAFFQQALGGLLVTVSTIGLKAAGVLPADAKLSFIVAAGITVLLSGLSVVSTVQDALTGYYLTSAARVVEIALLSAGLLVGVVLGLRFGFAINAPIEYSVDLPTGAVQFSLSVVAGATSAMFYALAGYAPLRSLPVAGAVGAASWAVFGLVNLTTDSLGPISSTGIAAVVVGIAAGLLRRGGRTPPAVITLAGVTPLLPGLAAYRGFYQFAVDGVAEGLVTITVALATGLALAAGVALGEFVTRPRRKPAEMPAEATPDPQAGTADGQ